MKIKERASRALHYAVKEVKQPRFRPVERKVIVWAVRALITYLGVKTTIDIGGIIGSVIK